MNNEKLYTRSQMLQAFKAGMKMENKNLLRFLPPPIYIDFNHWFKSQKFEKSTTNNPSSDA